jgi:hypothetical protein
MSSTVGSSSSSTTASDDTELRHGRRAAHHVEDDDARLRIFISLISSWVAARSSPASRSRRSTSARSAAMKWRRKWVCVLLITSSAAPAAWRYWQQCVAPRRGSAAWPPCVSRARVRSFSRSIELRTQNDKDRTRRGARTPCRSSLPRFCSGLSCLDLCRW